MALTVLQVGCPLARVCAEQVLARIDEGLVDRGHRSIVIAPEGSTFRGALAPIPAPGDVLDAAAGERAVEAVRRAIARVLERYPVDLVHLHGGDFESYLPPAGVPVLATLHLSPSAYSPGLFQIARPATYLQCLSAAERAACPEGAALVDDVPDPGAPMIDAYLDLYLRLVRAGRVARLLGPVFEGIRC